MTTSQPATKRWTAGALLWLAAMVIMASFQTWRGAYEDGIIFFGIVVLLAVDRALGERIGGRTQRLHIRRRVVWLAVIIAAVILVIAPRHEALVFGAMAGIGVLMIVLAWAPMATPPTESSKAIRRSGWLWASIGVVLCVWEATAFVLSVTMPGGSDAHPTISVLLDPALETLVGRIVFVGLWLSAGAGLVLIWRRK